jgi:hypothetical protein
MWNDNRYAWMVWPYTPHLLQSLLQLNLFHKLMQSSFVDYLNWIDFINIALSRVYVQCLYASLCDYKSASLSNKFISWALIQTRQTKEIWIEWKNKLSKITYADEAIYCLINRYLDLLSIWHYKETSCIVFHKKNYYGIPWPIRTARLCPAVALSKVFRS